MNLPLKRRPTRWIACALAVLCIALSHAADLPSSLTPDNLGGTERYLAYVSTDKPIYREGDHVYLRTVILNASDNTPLETNNTAIQVKITGPQGDVVHEGFSSGTDSVVGYHWMIPAGTAGGEYTAHITSPTLGVPETQRVFDIRAYRSPRLKTQIEFTRDGYGPGDRVKASVAIERAEGGVPQSASITAIARLDGKEIFRTSGLAISDSGVVDTDFGLPRNISSGEGSLSFVIEDGGVVETASKSLPILLQTLDMNFYPESGELIAGLQSHVYFQALLANGNPADVQGHIVELVGTTLGTNIIAEFSSEHEGRGLFVMTPQKDKRYAAVFTAPAGIAHPAKLPAAKNTGAIIKSRQDAYAYDEPIEFSVATHETNTPTRLTLHKREALLDSQTIDADTVNLDAQDAEGVLIATLWSEDGQPLAERLIYRHPRFGLNVELTLSEGPFVPGAKVGIDVLTTDDQGKPVEAIVGLTVTDDTVLELIEKRQQAPRLPAMVYLENEVLDLADAHIYLDSTDPSAARNIDLLLGTQGWRRFVLVDYANIKKMHPMPIERAMAENTPQPPIMFLQRNGMINDLQLAMPMAAEAMVIAEPVVQDDNPVAEAELPDPNAQVLEKQREPDVAEQLPGPNAEPELELADRALEAEAMVAADIAVVEQMRGGYVREFAFQARADRQPNERIDFSETLYWNTGVKTSPRNGRATIEFSLSDSVTTFRVMADAYGRNGAIGTADSTISSVEPFYITSKTPLHIVAGDVIDLPVTLVNASAKTMENASLRVTGNGIVSTDTAPITLAPGQRLRNLVKVKTTMAGVFPITIVAQAGAFTDTVMRTLTVKPAGFPETVNAGGLLSSATPFSTTVTIPDNVTDGSLGAMASVYPSPLASMQDALDALLREPHGCFEQTSSTNYPLVMAQQYFDSHTGIDPELIAKSQSLLKTGYGKLISFESDGNGYEWFGANPAHEALTAYGLMQFTDMAKVMQIDNAMINRTRQWLLDRRDGNGGFERNERALDSFGRAPAPTTDAYIVWALLESGQSPQSLAAEIAHIKNTAFNRNDSYINALAANILYIAGDIASAELLAGELVKASDNTGAISGATTSITGSGGDALSIETTSLALLAWLRDDEQWAAQVEKSIKWLFERSKSGRFGSTQSTVLALKAINTYDAVRAVPKQPGTVQLIINGNAIGKPVAFTKNSRGAIALPEFASKLTPGQHEIELRMTDGSKMPFSLTINYNTLLPTNAAIRPVQIKTALSHTSITEGEPLELQATITASESNIPTPIAVIGIPAGLELRFDQLKELVADGSISAFEVRQSELVLYWRALTANEKRMIPIGLTAEIPGKYTAPASRVYPYYTDEQKDWIEGHSIMVIGR